jgi:cysteate synthase
LLLINIVSTFAYESLKKYAYICVINSCEDKLNLDMKNFKPTKYTLICVATGREFEDMGWTLDDREYRNPSLVRTNYQQRQLELKSEDYGFYKFCDWLPIKRVLQGSSAPVTYRSEALAKHLGLSNLWITLNGYCPKRGAKMRTCSFKETEAYAVCGRMSEDDDRVLVVASAGNTARAFAQVCSDNNIKLLLVVPADNLSALWFTEPLNDCVKLIVSERGGDYFDAINLSNLVTKSSKFYAEGGAKNVARRDGMGTTVLSAVTTIGRIPDYYFQAVGSGTGAIAAWEANMRLIEDGRYGDNLMRLIVSQNAPFVPMFDAWRADSREMLPYDAQKARRDAELIGAKVLSNRRPPYGIAGGLYDALKATNGEVVVATNAQSTRACKLFKELEGVDIHPAAGVALASLVKMVDSGAVDKDACIMLNITGAGEEAMKMGRELWYLQPSKTFSLTPDLDEVVSYVESLF